MTQSHSLFDNATKFFTTFARADRGEENQQLLRKIRAESHGTIRFADNQSNYARFIRVPSNVEVEHVKDFIYKKWFEDRPSLVISVTGGAKAFHMRPVLHREFIRGLLKVASTTGALIITGGTDTGVMKLVGRTIRINRIIRNRKRPIHLIGIANWSSVANKKQLEVKGRRVTYTKPRDELKGEAPLEPNHTEFIFVDNGNVRGFGGEIEFRARFESSISEDCFGTSTSLTTDVIVSPTRHGKESGRTPVVLLVVEGGPNTLRTVHKAVMNFVPAVLFEGTGRCCDLLTKAYNLYGSIRKQYKRPEDAAKLKNELHKQLEKDIQLFVGANNEAGIGDDGTDYFRLIYECVVNRADFLSIVSLDAQNTTKLDIDLTILLALLRAASNSNSTKDREIYGKFRLALEWNRVDIVKNHIITDEQDWKLFNLDNYDCFQRALRRNQVEFVKLFLDHDFSLTRLFQTNDEFLASLYKDVLKEHPDIDDAPLNNRYDIYMKVLKPLIGDFFDADAALRSQEPSSNHETNIEVEQETPLCRSAYGKTRRSNNRIPSEPGQKISPKSYSTTPSDVDKELFLWSVVAGSYDFNMLFWSRGKNKICAALTAALIYRKTAQEEKQKLNYKIADRFEKLAAQILDRFYQQNRVACTYAMVRQVQAYGNLTWLELAIRAEAKQFVAQRAVQEVLNNIWYGFIDIREQSLTIIFSSIMLWYSGCLRYTDQIVCANRRTALIDESMNKANTSHRRVSKLSESREAEEVNLMMAHGLPNTDNNQKSSVTVHSSRKQSKGNRKIYKYFRNILKFVRAPYVKYLYNLYFHIIFLLLLSYVVLCEFFPLHDVQSGVCGPTISNPKVESSDQHDPTSKSDLKTVNSEVPYGFEKHVRPSILEYILLVWVSTLLCEEFRQFYLFKVESNLEALAQYLEVFWNQLDLLAILLFYVGFALRYVPSTECYCTARVILAVDLTLWFIRSLDIFAAIKRLGPKLLMIGEMINDLKSFMVMLTVFILGFGASIYFLIHGTKPFTWHLPRDIINLAYWQIFGELSVLEKFQDSYQVNGYVIFILVIAYMAIVNILLVNLLIAMFSNIFDRVQNDTDRIWKFQRYSLICEYLSKPALPPPFIVLSHIRRLLLYALGKCIGFKWFEKKYWSHVKRTGYKFTSDEIGEEGCTDIEMTEDAIGDEIYSDFSKMATTIIDEHELDEERNTSPQETVMNKISALEDAIQLISNQQALLLKHLNSTMNSSKTTGDIPSPVPDQCQDQSEEGTGNLSRLDSVQDSEQPDLTTITKPTSFDVPDIQM